MIGNKLFSIKSGHNDFIAMKQKQQELFQAETTWFHVFRTMIDNGDIAKMGPHAFTIYCVIKAHTNFSTGRAFPSIELIVEKTGISLAQVKRELKTLENMGYLTKEKKGRSNIYQLREKVEIQDDQGRPAAVATWDYLPSSVQAAVADLKNVLVTGELAGTKIVNIERLQVNIINAQDSVVINVNSQDIDKLPLDLKESLFSLREKLDKK